jgi:hypothetical protein
MFIKDYAMFIVIIAHMHTKYFLMCFKEMAACYRQVTMQIQHNMDCGSITISRLCPWRKNSFLEVCLYKPSLTGNKSGVILVFMMDVFYLSSISTNYSKKSDYDSFWGDQ